MLLLSLFEAVSQCASATFPSFIFIVPRICLLKLLMDLFIVFNWICGCEVRRICQPVCIGHIFQFSFYRNSSSIFLLSLFLAYRAYASYFFQSLLIFFLGTGLSKTTAELTAVLKIGVQHPSGCEVPKTLCLTNTMCAKRYFMSIFSAVRLP